MSEKIWYEDLGGFMTINNYFIILPTGTMSFEQKLNAWVRFFLYLGVILALLRNDSRYLFFGIIAAIIAVVVYQHEKRQMAAAEKFLEQKKVDVVNQKVCARSTIDNPFMNPTIADITMNPDRPPACDVLNEKVMSSIDQNFDARLFKDVSDLYGKMSSQREFYTVPSTTIPNDQTSFAEWLYGAGPTCKEGNGLQCNRNMYRPIGK